MQITVDDKVIDKLKIVWNDSDMPAHPTIANSTPEARVIRDFLSTPYWQSLARFYTEGVLNRTGRISNESGFLFDTDLEADDEPFEGVQLFDPLDAITMSVETFDRLMSRYFRLVLNQAVANQLSATKEEWWKDFVSATNQIEDRVKDSQ